MQKILSFCKSKTKKEWQDLCYNWLRNLRQWLADNGELGFLLGVILGLFIVSFFKLVVFLIALFIIIAFTVYFLAPDNPETILNETSNNKENNNIKSKEKSVVVDINKNSTTE